MAKAPIKTVAPAGEPAPQAQAGLRELPEFPADKPLPPGARGLTPEKAAEESRRFGRELSPEERTAAAAGAPLSVESAKKFRCATTDGLSAVVEKLGGGKYRVQVQKLHKGDAEQPAVEIDLARHEDRADKGPDLRKQVPLRLHGDGSPRPEPVVAFMLAAGIRGSERAIGCTPLE